MILAAALLLQAAVLPLQTTARPPRNQSPFCRSQERRVGTGIVPVLLARQCGTWQLPRRQVGVWLLAFEMSAFVEGAKTIAEARHASSAMGDATWLITDEKSRFPGRCKPALWHAYLIDFDGLVSPTIADRHDPRGFFYGYGHMGGWARQVLVNHVHAIQLLGNYGLSTPVDTAQANACPRLSRRQLR